MMSGLPVISGRDLVRVLSKLGYREVRRRSSHIRLSASGRKSITVPDYRIIDKSLLRKILRDAELSVAEFNKLRS